jgi:hypothetical protein
LANRIKNEAEENLSSLKLARDGQMTSLENTNEENAKLKNELDSLKSETTKFNHEKKQMT